MAFKHNGHSSNIHIQEERGGEKKRKRKKKNSIKGESVSLSVLIFRFVDRRALLLAVASTAET